MATMTTREKQGGGKMCPRFKKRESDKSKASMRRRHRAKQSPEQSLRGGGVYATCSGMVSRTSLRRESKENLDQRRYEEAEEVDEDWGRT